MSACPRCEGNSSKVIYYGLPHRFCDDEECACLWGPFSWFTTLLPFNGWFYWYSGPYLPALTRWLRGPQ